MLKHPGVAEPMRAAGKQSIALRQAVRNYAGSLPLFMRKQPMKILALKASTSRLIAPSIRRRFLCNEHGRLELAIIIDDDTSAEELRKAWPAIDQARKRLLDFQGTDFAMFRNHLKYQLAYMLLRERFSYAEVAMNANYDCLVNLCWVVDKTNQGLSDDAHRHYWAAHELLDSMGMKKQAIDKCLKAAIEEIQQGRVPWSLVDGPIRKQRVVDTLRQIGREIESEKTVIKELPKPDYMPLSTLNETN